MLELRKGIDILAAVGGIASAAEARALLDRTLDADNRRKLSAVKNAEALVKLANAVAMCRPERVFVVGPSEADAQACREHALATGEEAPLAMPGHTIHFDLPEDQGRMVDQTFYIVNEDEEASILAKKLAARRGARLRAHAHERHHGGQDPVRRVLQPRPDRRAGGRPGHHDLQLRLRAAQREHPVPQRARPVRRRGCPGRRLLHQRARPGRQQVRGHPEGPDLHGPQLVHDLQHVLHLRGQHADAEEGQPPLRGGPLHLLQAREASCPSTCSSRA